VTPQPQAQQHVPADAVMSGMPDHYLDNFTKMRNSSSRNNNNNGGEEEADYDFALYCWTFKCNGNYGHSFILLKIYVPCIEGEKYVKSENCLKILGTQLLKHKNMGVPSIFCKKHDK
jgi:hypothetical protein